MSSHREAPEISKDPVADNTDTYAFVSPDRPDTVTIITNYIPLEDPAGGPNFFEFGDDVLYEINVDNTGDGKPDITYEFGFTTTVRNPEHVPLQHRPDRRHRQPELQPAPDVHGHRGAQPAPPDARPATCSSPPCNVGLRSTPNYAGARRRGDLRRRRRDQGLRRPAPRRLLRRPRLGLRPRRPAPVPEPAPDPDAGRGRGQRAAGVQRPHDRDPGADHPAHRDGKRPTDPLAPNADDRRVGVGVPPEGPLPGRRLRLPGRAVHAGVAARQPAVQRGHRADGPQGRVEPQAAAARTTTSPSTSPGPSSASCCRSCTPACSRTWPRTRRTAPTCWRSC